MAKRFTFIGNTNDDQDIPTATSLSHGGGPYNSFTSTPFTINVVEFPAPGVKMTEYGSVYTDKWSRTYDSNDPLHSISITAVEADGKTFVVSTPLERDMPVHLSATAFPTGLNPAPTDIGGGGEGPFYSQTFFVNPQEENLGPNSTRIPSVVPTALVKLKTTPWTTDSSGTILSAPAATNYEEAGSGVINFKLKSGHTNRIGISNAQSIANITASAFKTFLQDKFQQANVKKITATIELQGEPPEDYYVSS